MIYYYLPVVLSVPAVLFVLDKNLKNVHRLFLIFFCSVVLGIAALRKPGVGPDDLNYINAYNKLSVWAENGFSVFDFRYFYMEFGYLSYLKLTSFFSYGSVELLFLLSAFISIHSIWKLSQQYSPYPALTLILYFPHYFLLRDLNQMRVALAFSILCYILIYYKRFPKITGFLLLVPTMFHLVAGSTIIGYGFLKLSLKKLFCLVFIVVTLAYFGISAGNYMQLIPVLGARLEPYLKSTFFEPNQFFSLSNLKYLFLFFSIVVCYLSKHPVFLNKYKLIVTLFLTGVLLRFAFLDVGILSSRVSTFLLTFEIFIIPILLHGLKAHMRFFCGLFIILYIFLQVYINTEIFKYINTYELTL